MLRNYLLSALRNIFQHRWYVLINLTGLSIGITLSLILFFHISVELGFDSHIPDGERLFRVVRSTGDGGGSSEVSPMLGDQLLHQFSEIEGYTRAIATSRMVFQLEKDGQKTSHLVGGGYFVDSTFFDILGIKPLYGDPNLSLRDPETMVVTESLAHRFFGDEIPVGRSLATSSGRLKRISAVIPDPPFDSHIQYEYLYPLVVYEKFLLERQPDLWRSHTWSGVLTYIKLQPGTTSDRIESEMDDFVKVFLADDITEGEEVSSHYVLQSVRSIHLQPPFSDDVGPRSNMVYLKIFGVVGFVILLIAGINFINIALALGLRRVREVGIRKVMGAEKRQIGTQFLIETGLLVLFAGLISLLLIELIFPTYAQLTGYPITSSQLFQLDYLPLLAAVLLFLMVAGGLAPALHAASFQPAQSIRAGRDPRAIVGSLRKGLLIFQFIISSAAIFCTLVIYMQSEYLLHQDPGFDVEHVLVVTPYGELREKIFDNLEEMKSELRKNPGILSVSSTSSLPGEHYSGEALFTEGVDPNSWPGVNVMRGDRDIVETIGLEMAEGKSFADLPYGTPAFMPNETAVRMLAIKDPVGKAAWNNLWGPYEGTITGVLKDYHHDPLQEPIGALVVENRPWATRYLLVRIQGGATRDAIRWMEDQFESRVPSGYYETEFLDEHLQNLYTSERNLSSIFKLFGLLGITISALGLLGMTALLVYTRRREIGIRKVLGATELNIHRLITKSFMQWIVIANVIALPLAGLLMKRWLENFAYHVQIAWYFFPLTLLISTLVAFTVMIVVSMGAVRTNPVNVLQVNS